MKIFTIFTQKVLHVGDKLDVPAESIPIGASVVFKNPSDTLSPVARGKCTGTVPALFTPSKNGQTANAHRMYKTFEVTEEA
jgi:hypothetical protein